MKKHKISISVDVDTFLQIQEGILQGRFRNTSHAFEYSVKKVLGGDGK